MTVLDTDAPRFTGRPIAAEKRLGGAERARRMRDPGFGRVFTEHLASVRWSAGRGWHDARLEPAEALTLSPAAIGLHYGQIVFEGFKAYALPGERAGLFRPDLVARRLQRSARRMAMPEPPAALFTEAVTELVRADRDWVPPERGKSLYLRPILLATEAHLGLRPSAEYLFLVLAFVTDTFFPGGVRPLTVGICEDYVRAAPGGTGEAKYPGNYAGTLLAAEQAHARGCDQVVWLDARERRWVEEMGGMNVFFAHGPAGAPRLSTPPLTGTILPGVTRDSLLTLAPSLGLPVTEAPMSVADWRGGAADGSITEAFACGTGAGVAPIGTVRSATAQWRMGDGEPGALTLRLRETLLDIQHGLAPDPWGWVHPVSPR
ncbi:branched-chain amino acid aminotransferase [Amycolatopsis sp. cmx-4-61]|uniref:branched-chain amino acid aminotransferase n=1 Tax=Amycolatopsis sp. cmx-4-61 TaxID=2790937 RepID=UPI0039790D13